MTSAHELAAAYAVYAAAQLGGDDAETIDFGLWLDRHWRDETASPDPCLDAADACRARGIEWFEEGGEVVGVLAGRYRGCYRVPAAETPPPIAPFLDDAPGCSTGSVLQERAHIHQPRAVDAVVAPPRPAAAHRFEPAAAVVAAPPPAPVEHVAGGV